MIILSCSAPRMNSSPLPSPLRGEGEYFSAPRSRSEFFPRHFRERARVRVFLAVMLVLLVWSSIAFAQLVKSVETVGMTVSDVDRSVEFFVKVLGFEQVSDVEVHGAEYEKLQGVFGARTRVVRMKLGEEVIELTEYLAPEGRPIPSGSRSNDHWFQHIAVVVSDMDKAYQQLRAHKVRHASTGPQTIPASNKAAAGIRAFYFNDPDGHNLEIIYFPPGKGDPRWQKKR
jgi:catechol 2,3-dioxygenase-like lactoylglutathione lyase family enzyme